MKIFTERGAGPELSTHSRLGAGGWSTIAMLCLLLLATCFAACLGWNLASGIDVPPAGYLAMAFGVIFSLAVGVGLMALVFYSSRSGYDEAPTLITPQAGDEEASRPAEGPGE
ncbi:MAG TPA: hypothetical protein VKY22_26595 [Bradyrhizobium sp.]|jgi:hypothetical protein|nr:hypothetical protein [Bradyrhizobium sp.]